MSSLPPRPVSAPVVQDVYFTERDGIIAVEQLFNRMRCIWRETTNKDVGIDGQVEFVDSDGRATGHVIAVQVKSGASYFLKSDDRFISFYPEAKHRHYWETFPLPVILVLHDPRSGIAYWEDARRCLRGPNLSGEKAIRVPRNQTLDFEHKDELFETCGAFGERLLEITEVLDALIQNQTSNPQFPLSFFDLFVNGLTDIGRKLFFAMNLCMEIVEYKSDFGVSIGAYEYGFLDDYIKFLVAQHLAVIDYSDYLIDAKERAILPVFIVPLTTRGRQVLNLIHEIDKNIVYDDLDAKFKFGIAYERYVVMNFSFRDFRRLDQIAEFERLYRQKQLGRGSEAEEAAGEEM